MANLAKLRDAVATIADTEAQGIGVDEVSRVLSCTGSVFAEMGYDKACEYVLKMIETSKPIVEHANHKEAIAKLGCDCKGNCKKK